jgi:hypothetical protein
LGRGSRELTPPGAETFIFPSFSRHIENSLRGNIAKIKTKVETMCDKNEGPHNDLEDIKREVASIEKRLMFFETAKK